MRRTPFRKEKGRLISDPEELAVSIITVKREPEYIHTTLASLFAADPWAGRMHSVNLYVGSNDASYLDCYAHHERITVKRLSDGEWDSIKDMSIWQRLCHNNQRALHVPCGARGLIFLEDDVVLKDGFVHTLIDTIQEIDQRIGKRKYLLACYCPYRWSDKSLRRGKLFMAYPCWDFYGTQFMFYPKAVVQELAGYFARFGSGDESMPNDMIVKKYGTEITVEQGCTGGIYACTQSLAQHIGKRTTGVGTFHQSPTF